MSIHRSRPMGSAGSTGQRYSTTVSPGGDLQGQKPPTDAQPIRQRAQLGGDPMDKMPRRKSSVKGRQYGGY